MFLERRSAFLCKMKASFYQQRLVPKKKKTPANKSYFSSDLESFCGKAYILD